MGLTCYNLNEADCGIPTCGLYEKQILYIPFHLIATWTPMLSKYEYVHHRYICAVLAMCFCTCIWIVTCTIMCASIARGMCGQGTHVKKCKWPLSIFIYTSSTAVNMPRYQQHNSRYPFYFCLYCSPCLYGGEIVKCWQCNKEQLISVEYSLALQTHCHHFYAAHYTVVKFS